MDDNLHPERRGGDEHTREIVKMTVHEIFDGVSVDLTTPEGRQRFRDNIAFLDDARVGTSTARKTILGLAVTGICFGIWKVLVWFAAVVK